MQNNSKLNKTGSTVVRILTIQIAVLDDGGGLVEDEISALLSENGIYNDGSCIVDWIYLTQYKPEVEVFPYTEEGEVFEGIDLS